MFLSAILVGLGLVTMGVVDMTGWDNSNVPLTVGATLCFGLSALLRGWVVRCLMVFGTLSTATMLCLVATESQLLASLILLMLTGLTVKIMFSEETIRPRIKRLYDPFRAALIWFVVIAASIENTTRDTKDIYALEHIWVLPVGFASINW